MAESNSREVFFLKQVANQKYNKDFAVNMVQVNNTLTSISKYLIVMQQGIDDLNRDILEQIQDFIRELIIIFNGGNFEELGLDFGHLKYVFRAIGEFFGFGKGLTGVIDMAQNFFEFFLAPFQWFGNIIGNLIDGVIDFILSLISWIPGVGNARQRLASALNTTKQEVEYTHAVADSANTVAVQTTFNVASNKPLHDTMDPTAQGSLRWADLTWDPNTQSGLPRTAIESNRARISKIRIQSDQVMNTISFVAAKTNSSTQVHVDLFQYDWDTQMWELEWSSNDVGPLIGIVYNLISIKFSEDGYPVNAGELYAVRFTSNGTVNFAAKQFMPYFLPGFEPEVIAASYTTTFPRFSNISNSQMDSWNDGVNIGVWIGSDVGQVNQPRSYYVNFDLGQWNGWLRRSSSGSDYLGISNKRVVHTGDGDNWQHALYGAQVATDQMEAQVDFVDATTRAASVGIGLNQDSVGGVSLVVRSDQIAIDKVNGIGDFDQLARSTTSAHRGSGSYKIRYDPALNRYIAFKYIQGSWVEVLSAASPAGISRGPGKRFAGIWIHRSFFVNGSPIDNFHVRDWRE